MAAAYRNSSTDAAAARDGDSAAALLGSGARTAMTRIGNDSTAGLYPHVRTAAPYVVSPGVLAGKENGMAYLVDSRCPRTASQEEDVTVHYLGYRGEMLPYPTQTTVAVVDPAAAYYDSGEALPLASDQVFGGNKMTSVPAAAVDVGQDKVVGAFTERLRRWLPVLGISVASLAVAGLAAGEPDPAAGFGLFLMLIVGLSAVTISVIRA
ncbi:unnamed protein product [Urochloa decumbens]|uniref:Uncharacterized protein n=1 Tax=Urochloa decumbens TaxID=240449 RepID=A0ABC9BUQ5_9POAL